MGQKQEKGNFEKEWMHIDNNPQSTAIMIFFFFLKDVTINIATLNISAQI